MNKLSFRKGFILLTTALFLVGGFFIFNINTTAFAENEVNLVVATTPTVELTTVEPNTEIQPIENVSNPETPATPAETQTLTKEIWNNIDTKATTNDIVELGKTYVAPQNDQVTVTFTKLPENPGKLSIEEITLTAEQITSLGALSDKAYDITSDMADGTFTYDLTLPKPANQENVQIKFAETEAGLENADTVATSDITTETDSVSTSLDHFTIFVVTDQTPTAPLSSPNSSAQPRYISGFGLDNNYTIFYEDRNDPCGGASQIYFNRTTSGPLGLSATGTATNVCDTHFIVKDWPITIDTGMYAGTYAYRAWGAGTYSYSGPQNFYVSNDLINWTRVTTFTFDHPSDGIAYGFHDIVKLNGHYIGWVESNGGNTYIASSINGEGDWTVGAQVGGATVGAAPLSLYFFPGITGPKPSGNFVKIELDGVLTYAKIYLAGNYSGAYMAINKAAAQATTPALAEDAFMNPANWTWRDGTIGLPKAADTVISNTKSSGGHDIREGWTVPTSNYQSDYVFLYTANYGTGANGLGYLVATDTLNLGIAANFATLGTAVTLTNATVTGNVGSTTSGATTITTSTVNGTTYALGGEQAVLDAHANFLNTYGTAAAMTVDVVTTGTLDGAILSPGVYSFDTSGKTGTLTLDAQGDPNAVWILKSAVATGYLEATNFNVVFLNSVGKASNVFWWTDAAATVTDSNFQGTILSGTAITVTRGTLNGRVLAKADVTVTGPNTITVPGVIPACTTTCYVNGATGNDTNSGISDDNAKKTIQAAITQVSADGTVYVAAGTYVEQLNINKNLTIIGVGDATIIQAPTTLIEDGLAKKNIIEINNGATANISNVTITGPGSSSCGSIDYGLYVIGGAALNLSDSKMAKVQDSSFSGCQNGIAIRVQSSTAIINNVIITDYQKGGIVIDGSGSSATITNNTITGAGNTDVTAQNGIQISRGATAIISGNTVTGNSYHKGDVWDWGATGILLYQSGAVTMPGGNIIYGNDLNIDKIESGSLTLHNNSIGTSTVPAGIGFGVKNEDTDTIDATNNWWGDASGPKDTKNIPGTPDYNNPTGLGAAVSSYINYKPWCTTDSGCTTFSSDNPTTVAATVVTITTATVNGTNGASVGDDTSFWLGTTFADPFTPSTNPASELPGEWSGVDSLTQSANAAFSHAYSGLTPNTTYYFVAWSEVGGTWYPGEILNFTTDPILDTTAPTVPVLTSPINGVFINNNAPLMQWDDSTDIGGSGVAGYEYQVYYNCSDSSNILSSCSSSYKHPSLIIDSELQGGTTPDGTYYWQVRAKDNAGNFSDWSGLEKVTIDTTSPNFTITRPTAAQVINNRIITINGTATDTNFNYYYCYVSNVNGHEYGVRDASCTTTWHAVTPAGLLGSVTLSNDLPDGNYVVHLIGYDKAGNSAETTKQFVLDNTAPTVDLVFPIPGPSATSFQAVFSEDVNSTEATNPANYFLNNWPGAGGSGNLDGHATVSYNSTSYIATITFTTPGWSISPEQQWGVQNIHDLAGNVQATNPVEKYSTPMIAPVTTATLGGTKGLNDFYVSDVTVNLTADDGDSTVGSGVKVTHYSVDGADFTIGTSILVNTDGEHTIRYYSEDNAGNVETEKSISFKIDQTAPIPTLSSIAITTPATKLTYTVDDALDISGMVVTGTYSDDSTSPETITTGDIAGFDSSAPATDQVLTITVDGETTTYTINVIANNVVAKTLHVISSGSFVGFAGATSAVGQVLGAEKYNFTLFLKKGPPYLSSQANEIMELQKFLNTAGFGILVVDGKFGPKTKAAVIKFQIANGLKGDGVVGPLTRAVLNK